MNEEYDFVILKPPLDDVLEHHGVKGMKWGIRKQKISLGLNRARRKINTGVSQISKSRNTNYAKKAKNRKGYSAKDYAKYRKKGMSHTQAIAAAKKARKIKIAAVVTAAAAITIGVLVARKHNIKVQDAKRLANQTGDTKALEKQLREQTKAQANAWKNYKFDDVDHYARAKRGALEQKWTQAVKAAGGDQTKVDPKKIKVSGNDIKKYAHNVTQMQNEAARRVEARKLKNVVKAGAKRWWNGR